MTLFIRHAVITIAVFFLLSAFNQKCAVGSISMVTSKVSNYRLVTIPFSALQGDGTFRPHQIITVGVQKNFSSPVMPATFIFDTGTDGTCISASLAERLGLPQFNVTLKYGNYGDPTPQAATAIKAASLEVGGLRINNFIFIIRPDQQLSGTVGQPIDGILGLNFLSSFVTRIDFTHSQITFTVPAATTLSYDTLSQHPVELSSSQIAEQGFDQALVIPLTANRGEFLVSIVLRNGKTVTTDTLLIDSGGADTCLSQPAAHKLNLVTVFALPTTSVFGKHMDNYAWLSGLMCGDVKLSNLLISSQGANTQIAPHLGLDVLANYDVLLDAPHRKMYLKPRQDLQAVTSRQYAAAFPIERRQWAQKTLIVIYPTTTGNYSFAIPYDLTPNGLPLAQVRPDFVTPPVPFLLKSNTDNIFMSDALAHQWRITTKIALDDAGKPHLQNGQIIHLATVPALRVAGVTADMQVGVFPAGVLQSYDSHLSTPGIIGANLLFARPLLMDPATQTWMQFVASLSPEDLTSQKMADAAVVDILDPDGDGIPALAVQVQQSTTQFTDTMTLATGSPFTLVSAKAAQALKLMPEPQKLTYGTGKDMTVFNRAHLSHLSIGGVVLKDVLIAYPDGAMPDGFYPRLGMNVISKLRLLVDAPAKKLYVKKAGD